MLQISPHQAKYYAYQLTKRCPADTPEKLSATLLDAQVDLNPHQIDTALFAFQSPLSKGAILADEVGLGKTIEAGILLSQKWAERKNKLLIIVPSNLRSQWNQELLEKFYLPSIILETKSFNAILKDGIENPFDLNTIVICSYHFARNKEDYINKINWDLVVLDEAHKLRNVYRTDNKIGKSIKQALTNSKKVLLTATPLQNSLLELYGLVSIIDEHIFGDLKSYKSQFSRADNNDSFTDLKERLKPICKRNLRKNVQEYINYKNRIPITIEFLPTDEEQTLYEMVSEYLRKENLQALPSGQRHLMTLILRKLLASSTFAISNTLDMLAKKLKKKLKKATIIETYDDIIEDFSASDEICDEWDDDANEPEVLTVADVTAIENEISELEAFRDLAESIILNAKGEKLQTALEQGFVKARELGAREKALIFTESTRTQKYLNRILQEIPEYTGKTVLFNGSNNDEKSKEIYSDWIKKNQGTDKITDSKTSNVRAAIIDYFRNDAKIMIATEAGAEGINLQFCSIVINYDLPWNPQRIEQRIGRCHRYGQDYDVVVVNFVNKANKADQRVFELLRDKFQLFSGVFGASDEILGVIESGVDFEKSIAAIYQNCRTKEEIQESFDRLQAEMDEKIATNT
jgi:SNF2 family DNA or RNA helicase